MSEAKLRVNLDDSDLLRISKEDLIQKWKLQVEYLDYLEDKVKNLGNCLNVENLNYEKKIKELEDSKNLEIVKLKNLLLMKYMTREQENQVN